MSVPTHPDVPCVKIYLVLLSSGLRLWFVCGQKHPPFFFLANPFLFPFPDLLHIRLTRLCALGSETGFCFILFSCAIEICRCCIFPARFCASFRSSSLSFLSVVCPSFLTFFPMISPVFIRLSSFFQVLAWLWSPRFVFARYCVSRNRFGLTLAPGSCIFSYYRHIWNVEPWVVLLLTPVPVVSWCSETNSPLFSCSAGLRLPSVVHFSF